MIKKMLAVLLILGLMLSSFGCSNSEPAANGSETEGGSEPAEEISKVALVLVGPINDGGWNALAYNGLVRIGENYDNVETSYAENVPYSDYEDVYRMYAEQGFDLVIGHGFEFSDVSAKVSAEYPDTNFVVVNGANVGENLASVSIDNGQVGFMAGALAAMLSESGKVGSIGGLEIPPIVQMVKAFVAGAEYINPDIEVVTAMTGSFEAVAECKEIAVAMVADGADVLMADADQSNLGAIEAADEGDVYYVGVNADLSAAAPDTVVTTALVDGGVMFTYIYDKFLDGTLEGDYYNIGLKEGAAALAPWGAFEDKISDEIKADLAALMDELENHSFDYQSLVDDVNL